MFDIFDKNNIKEVTINFYGSGDDGNMEMGDVLVNSDDDKIRFAGDFNWDEPTIFGDINLYDLIREVSDTLLDKKGIDYANGNGNEGCITYTVKNKDVSMSYLITEDAEYNFSVK